MESGAVPHTVLLAPAIWNVQNKMEVVISTAFCYSDPMWLKHFRARHSQKAAQPFHKSLAYRLLPINPLCLEKTWPKVVLPVQHWEIRYPTGWLGEFIATHPSSQDHHSNLSCPVLKCHYDQTDEGNESRSRAIKQHSRVRLKVMGLLQISENISDISSFGLLLFVKLNDWNIISRIIHSYFGHILLILC